MDDVVPSPLLPPEPRGMTLFRLMTGAGLLVWFVVGSLLNNGEAQLSVMATLTVILGAMIHFAEPSNRRGIADA